MDRDRRNTSQQVVNCSVPLKQIYTKKLSKTDVGVRLSFPMKFLNAFEFPEGEDKVEFEATDVNSGEAWTFGLTKRNKDRHLHPKPVVSSGWRAYVQAKQLGKNDRVILSVLQDKAFKKTKFEILAQKKAPEPVMLFGTKLDDWVNV